MTSDWSPHPQVHTTFQYGGADGKRWRLREAMLWEDPPSYYDPPGGLLRYEPHVPEALLSPERGVRMTLDASRVRTVWQEGVALFEA